VGRLLLELVVLLAVVGLAAVVVYRVASRSSPRQVLDASLTWKPESRSEDGLTTVVAVVLVSRRGEITERRQLATLDNTAPDYDAAVDAALERAASTAFLLNSRREL
jgi:hypothetical protein